MVELTPINEMEKQATVAVEKTTDIGELIKKQKEQDLSQIAQSSDFKEMSLTVNAREAYNELKAKDNELKDKELTREWEEYLLKKKKEAQDYQSHLERKIVKQGVKADVHEKKREIAIKRYGYLYAKNADGTPKDFTVNKVINKYKEIETLYNSLAETTKKTITTTVKFLLKAGIAILIVFAGYGVIRWIIKSGLILLA